MLEVVSVSSNLHSKWGTSLKISIWEGHENINRGKNISPCRQIRCSIILRHGKTTIIYQWIGSDEDNIRVNLRSIKLYLNIGLDDSGKGTELLFLMPQNLIHLQEHSFEAGGRQMLRFHQEEECWVYVLAVREMLLQHEFS